jgi:methyl-accepting chemotaxis protein
LSNETVSWITSNADILAKLFGAGATISGGIYGFVKLIKYLAKARKRTDEKLDAISSTLSEQHTKDFTEVKNTLTEFKGSLEIIATKMDNIVDRADRVESNVNQINSNLIEFKGNIESTESTVKRNNERIADVEDKLTEYETRILTIELERPVKAYKKSSSRRKSKGKKKVK